MVSPGGDYEPSKSTGIQCKGNYACQCATHVRLEVADQDVPAETLELGPDVELRLGSTDLTAKKAAGAGTEFTLE